MIDSTAIVSKQTNIGNNVQIGAYSIIHDNVTIGENTIIGAYCEIGITTGLAKNSSLLIGANSVIRSKAVIDSLNNL